MPDTLKWVEPPTLPGARLAPVGGFVSIPPKHRHFAWAGNQATIVQVHGVGPTDLTFVDPADDPRKK